MILDIIFIELSFFIACMVRYDTFMHFFGNLYTGILRRGFTDELKSVFL